MCMGTQSHRWIVNWIGSGTEAIAQSQCQGQDEHLIDLLCDCKLDFSLLGPPLTTLYDHLGFPLQKSKS